MKVLITLLGPSIWGLYNSVWAMIRAHGFVPERVYVMGRDRDRDEFNTVQKMLSALLGEYGQEADIRFEQIEGGSIDDIKQRVRGILDAEGEEAEIALDVTPGRKAAVLGSLMAGGGRNGRSRFDHIFYLYIESLRNASRPYMLIPVSMQRCHEVPRESKEVRL